MPSYLEFFAGGGMVRAGLGDRWKCHFANDFDPLKVQVYVDNWGEEEIVEDDIHKVEAEDLGPRVDLAWASFPCQDLSTRKETLWPSDLLMASSCQRRAKHDVPSLSLSKTWP